MKMSNLIFGSMIFVLLIMLFCIVGKSEEVSSYFKGMYTTTVANEREFILHPPAIEETPLATVLKQFEENESERLIVELSKKDISTPIELQSGEVILKDNGEVAGWVKADPDIAYVMDQQAKFDKLLAARKAVSKQKAHYTRPAKIKTKAQSGSTAGSSASTARNRISRRQRTTSFRKPNWLQSLSQTLDRSRRQNSEYSLKRQRKQDPYTP